MNQLLNLLDYSICKLNAEFNTPDYIWLSLDFRYIISRLEVSSPREINKAVPTIYNHLNRTYKNQIFLFPAFTFNFPKTGLFSTLDTRPETTAFASRLFKIGDFPRTIHPFYSFFITDPGSKGFLNQEYYDCVGSNSIFEYLIKSDTAILCIGHHFVKTFTPVHHLEYILGATYREPIIFEGKLTGLNNTTLTTSTLFFGRKKGCMRSGLTYPGESMLRSQDISFDVYYNGIKAANTCHLSKAATSLISYPLGVYISSLQHNDQETTVITNEGADLIFLGRAGNTLQ
jgi:hypothetical protein